MTAHEKTINQLNTMKKFANKTIANISLKDGVLTVCHEKVIVKVTTLDEKSDIISLSYQENENDEAILFKGDEAIDAFGDFISSIPAKQLPAKNGQKVRSATGKKITKLKRIKRG